MNVLSQEFESETLLIPSEVAEILRVDPKTITQWSKAGKLHAVKTLGGHRRYKKSEILLLSRLKEDETKTTD